MTSEPDSTPRRRPPTIDLTATEVGAAKPDSTQESGATEPPQAEQSSTGNARRRFAPGAGGLRPQAAHIMGAAVGAVVVVLIFAALWLAGVLPLQGSAPVVAPSPVAVAPAPDATVTKEILARLDKIEAAGAASRPDETLTTRIAAAEAETKTLDNSLAALNRRLDDIAVTARTALAHADAATAAAEASKTAAQAGVQRSDIDALASRVTALDRTMQTLSSDVAHRPASADDRAARMTVATEALRSAVERGAPYVAELAAVKSLGVEASAAAPLEPFAAAGVPSAATLANGLSALTPALLRASGTAPGENTFLGRIEANAQKIVRVTPVDAPPGDDPAAVVARSDAAAARGDITAALADLSHLPDAAHALAESWIKKAEAREAAIAASRSIAAAALAALSKPVSQ